MVYLVIALCLFVIVQQVRILKSRREIERLRSLTHRLAEDKLKTLIGEDSVCTVASQEEAMTELARVLGLYWNSGLLKWEEIPESSAKT